MCVCVCVGGGEGDKFCEFRKMFQVPREKNRSKFAVTEKKMFKITELPYSFCAQRWKISRKPTDENGTNGVDRTQEVDLITSAFIDGERPG